MNTQMIPYTDTSKSISIPMPSVPTTETIESVRLLARYAAQSGMVKVKGSGDAGATAFFIAMYGLELGIPAMTAMRTIYSVGGGAPTCSGEALLSLLRRSGKVRVTVPDPATITESATVKMKRLDTGEEGEFTFTLEMARKAGLLEKNVNWKNYPHMMLIWRAVSMGSKLLCSDITGGLYTVEEIYSDTPVDENGAPIADIVITGGSTGAKAAAPADDVHDANFSEIDPTPDPEPAKDNIRQMPPVWPSIEALNILLTDMRARTVDNLSPSEYARLAGISAFDKLDEWKAKYPKGADVRPVVLAAFEAEMAPATPKNQPPAHQWTAEDIATLDKHAADLYALPHAEALQHVGKTAWSDFVTPEAARTALKVAVIDKLLPVVARKAKYVVTGKTGYTLFIDTPVEIRMYGSSDEFKRLGESFVKLIEPLKAGKTVDLPMPVSFDWEKKTSEDNQYTYFVVKKGTPKEVIPF